MYYFEFSSFTITTQVPVSNETGKLNLHICEMDRLLRLSGGMPGLGQVRV